ncbi:MAG: CcdB family protein [Nitratireductor sp.]|nr:CcdB family protein [Nitratireductor sp.]
MAKYDVYPDPAGNGYLLDVQSDLLGEMNTRVVVPLMLPANAPVPGRRLNPAFDINGTRHLMVTQYLSAVPAIMLDKPVTNLSNHFAEITNAIDMVFQGF